MVWQFLYFLKLGSSQGLNTDSEFNAVVTSLKPGPGPVQSVKTKSSRPVVWISLRTFTVEESETALAEVLNYPILEDHALSELKSVVKICISDVGWHPRSLETLKKCAAKGTGAISRSSESSGSCY